MKKINSIGYGSRVLGIGLGLILCGSVLGLGLRIIGVAVTGIGVLILLGMAVLLSIEGVQDRRNDRRYQRHHHSCMRLVDGRIECQHCGYRGIRAGEQSCPVCGVRFDQTPP